MSYIYKITNTLNGKSYIGKTERDIYLRFSEHKAEAKANRAINRPLYRAINKYGIDSFTIELLEETNDAEEREIYWIEFFGTYSKNGYNATLGGEGTAKLNYPEMLEYYLQNYENISIREMANNLKVDYWSYLDFVKSKKLGIKRTNFNKKSVQLLEDNQIFKSLSDAARYVISLGISNSRVDAVAHKISLNCRQQRKSAFGFTWQFI